MSQVPSIVVLGVALCLLTSRDAMAQQFEETGVVYEAGRNKIGLILYCRSKDLLDPAVADKAVMVLASGLMQLRVTDPVTREQGDRAQQAGTEGFWEAGRRRDIATVAKQFNTTPADLCGEWADETLRVQAPKSRGEVAAIAVVKPPEPAAKAKPAPSEPPEAERRTAPMAAVVSALRFPPPPPPPVEEKARYLPPETERPVQRSAPKAATPSAPRTASAPAAVAAVKTPATVPQPSRRGTPPLARPAGEPASPPARKQAVAAEAPPRPIEERERSSWRNWPFIRLGKRERCWMPGCKWPTPQERRWSTE